jgi:hypothetical protein
MSDAEYQWRRRLKPVNLVVETDFAAEEIRTLQSNYGAAARQLLNRGCSHRQIIRKYPALTLTMLVGHAALAYDQGAYWESFWDELRLSRDADFENEIRRSITELLDKFSLARFPEIERDSARKYVMLLALHAGIPVHCLGDLLKLVNEHIVDGRDPTGAALMAWLDEPGKGYRTAALDVPVRNFLMYGAEFAVDILDRIIEFVEAANVNPSLLDEDLDSSTTGLPSALLSELIDQLREKPFRWKNHRSSAGNTAVRPTISYCVDDDEVVVAVPYPAVEPEVPWRVSFDGEVREIHAVRKWGVGAQPPPTQVPVLGPVREVVLSHRPSEVNLALAAVIKSDPLLVFSVDGKWIPRRDGLKDAIWAVYPEDHQLVDPGTGDLVDEVDIGSPSGWHGWRSARVELDAVSSLQLRHEERLIGTARAVRKDARPRFALGEPVPGVSASQGRPVYGSRPWVILPPSILDPAPSWRVRVRRHGATEWIADESWDAEEEETCVDPFDDVDTPQLGLFEIVVTGPLGADARAIVFVAEGLWVEFDTTIRVPVVSGLTACDAIVGSDVLTIVSEGHVTFGVTDLEKTVELSNGEVAAQLAFKPPHVELRTGEVGSPARWRITPDSCSPEDFLHDRFVAVRAPGVDRAEMGFVTAAGELVHIERNPKRKPGGVFEFDARRFADTARTHGTGRLIAVLCTDSGSTEVTVISVQPRKLASDVELCDGLLRFEDLPDSNDLATYVWCTTAPWRPAQVLPIIDNAAQLPADLLDAGELTCQVFVDDPWVSLAPPTKPAEDAFRVSQPGWFRQGTIAQTRLSRFIAGNGPLPEGIGAAPEIWTALSWLDTNGQHDRASHLIKLLAEQPRIALEGLGNSTIPLHDKMAMLIRSELVNRSYASLATLNELHADPWFGCMVEMSDLPSLYRRRAEVPEERAETIGYLSDKGGELLVDLLRSGKTAALQEGCFDRSVFAMGAMPADQIEAILRELDLVPGPLLHPDTRFSAAYEAFRQRDHWMRSGWSESFAVQTSFVLEPIKRASVLAYEAIKMRSDLLQGIDFGKDPWMLMSLQSLTLAFLARLEAQGRIEGHYLNSGLLMAWSRLAQLCPDMVATDLLIAEALIMYDRRGDLIGEAG